jgi:hypothetical protein
VLAIVVVVRCTGVIARLDGFRLHPRFPRQQVDGRDGDVLAAATGALTRRPQIAQAEGHRGGRAAPQCGASLVGSAS